MKRLCVHRILLSARVSGGELKCSSLQGVSKLSSDPRGFTAACNDILATATRIASNSAKKKKKREKFLSAKNKNKGNKRILQKSIDKKKKNKFHSSTKVKLSPF